VSTTVNCTRRGGICTCTCTYACVCDFIALKGVKSIYEKWLYRGGIFTDQLESPSEVHCWFVYMCKDVVERMGFWNLKK
jgi:hypothetical protein